MWKKLPHSYVIHLLSHQHSPTSCLLIMSHCVSARDYKRCLRTCTWTHASRRRRRRRSHHPQSPVFDKLKIHKHGTILSPPQENIWRAIFGRRAEGARNTIKSRLRCTVTAEWSLQPSTSGILTADSACVATRWGQEKDSSKWKFSFPPTVVCVALLLLDR